MPMQLANASCVQTHVHPGDLFGDLEVRLGDLTGPAAVLDTPRRVVERSPELREVPYVCCGRGERLRKLPGKCRVLRSRVDGAARVALCVHDALGRLVRITERRREGGGCGSGTCRRSGCKDAAT